MSKIIRTVAIVVVAILVVGGIAGGVAYWAVSRATNPGTEVSPEEKKVALQDLQQFFAGEFATNLADPDRSRFIQVEVYLLVKHVKSVEELKKVEVALKDLIVGILRSFTTQQVAGEEGKNRLAAEIARRTNEMLGNGLVEKVVFTNMVVQ